MTNLDNIDPYDLSLDDLAAALADFAPQPKKAPTSAVEERIIAGFEEILDFYHKKKRLPAKTASDIFERLFAIRLAAIKENETCRAALEGYDPDGVLSMEIPDEVAVKDDFATDHGMDESCHLAVALDDINVNRHDEG